MAVIGWIFLGLILFLLIMLLLLLFYPFTYYGKGRFQEKTVEGSVKVSWLFGLVQARYQYPDPGQTVICVFGIRLGRRKGKSSRSSSKSQGEACQEPSSSHAQEKHPDSETTESKEPVEPVSEHAEGGEKKQSLEREDDAPSKSTEKRNVREKLSGLAREMKYYQELLTREETKSLITELFSRVGKLLVHLCPRRIEGHIVWGASSPDVTGYVFAGYSMLRIHFPRRVIIELLPDFEREILEGNVRLKGRVSVFTILYHILKIILDRRTRKLLKEIKRHKQ